MKKTLICVCGILLFFGLKAWAQFPSIYDLRSLGCVSPVKDQGACGSCWAFAAIAAIESNGLKNGYGLTVLSEDNVIDCHGFDESPCYGGSYYMAAALLSRHDGPLTLTDDPYTPGTGDCPLSQLFPPSSPFYVEEIRWIPATSNDIKQALMDYGAVASTMFFNMVNYNASTYKYYDGSIDAADSLYAHCVAIVGWNDTLTFSGSPGPGGWIIKDSYGTSWAQNGFFYVSYYDAGILSENVVFPTRQGIPNASNLEYAYLYDELGWVDQYGFNNPTAYALVKYHLYPYQGMNVSQEIKRVGTYVVADGTSLEVKLFHSFNGSTLSDLIDSATLNCPFKGFYTLPFDVPSDTIGTDIYILIKYMSPAGTLLPIPVEQYEAGHTSAFTESFQSAWISPDASTWILTGNGSSYHFDPCIKLYVEHAPYAKIAAVPDTVCKDQLMMLNQNCPAPFDSVRWLINGSYASSQISLPYACTNPGPLEISLIVFLGTNNDTARATVYVAHSDTAISVWNSTITSLANNVSWQWLDCNNGYMPLNGETAQSFTAVIDGSYAVRIEEGPCVDTSRCVTISNAGILETRSAKAPSVYPNPSQGWIQVLSEESARILIMDPAGRLVFERALDPGQNQINLEGLTDGIYLARITSWSKVTCLKLTLSR